MISILRSDLLKTRKRAMGWVMLAIGAALIALVLGVAIFAPPTEDVPSFAYPSGLLMGAQVLTQLGGLMMIVFGATLVGSEYGFDTWKNLLTRRPGRAAFILSKWIVLALALLIATVVLPAWAQALGFLFGDVLPPAAAVDLPLGAVLMQVGLSAVMPLVAGTLGVMGAVIGRSSVSGIIAGIVWMIVDVVLAQLLPGGLKLVSFNVAMSMLGANLAGQTAPVGLLPSLLVALAYVIVPLGVAAYLFQRRDMA
ncbi:MAG: ABC transporter permease [Kouleothrix sp.]|nr:ABC transporter permease [Kouleothrix sp.]